MLLETSALLMLFALAGNDPDEIRRRHACQSFLEELRDIGSNESKRREALARFGYFMEKLGCLPRGHGPAPASTVKATQLAYRYRLPGRRTIYQAPAPLMLPREETRPQPQVMPPPESAAEPPEDMEVQEIVVTAIRIPDVPTCDGPAAGWIGLVDTNDPDAAVRRVQFDSSPPVYSSAARNTVPELGGRLEFSSQFPAQVFASLIPCYSDDPCRSRPMSGAFRVVSRVSFPAGPRGYLRWQLCILPTVKAA